MNADDVQDIFPLSGMQQALLVHGLRPGGTDQGFLQYRCAIHGPLHVESLQKAWGQVVERCDILRTSFVWDGLDDPLQVVHRTVVLPWMMEDWSGLSADRQAARLKKLVEDDRARAFDLSSYPLTRLALVRMSSDSHVLLWSHHHLQVDGWSVPIIFREVFLCHDALRHGREPRLEPRRPFRDYLAWLQGRDQAAAERYWRGRLRGFTEPTPLAVAPPMPSGASGFARASNQLPAAVLSGLEALAKAHNVTLNTLIQAAWALVLSRRSGRPDVVFGAAVSGRPPSLPGVEQMVGTFINNLPVRVRVQPERLIADWLEEIFSQQTESQEFDYAPLNRIEEWSEISARERLFESLVLFDNAPDPAAVDCGEDMRIGEADWGITSSFPFTLSILPRAGLVLHADYDRARLSAAEAEQMLRDLGTALSRLAALEVATVSDLQAALGSTGAQHQDSSAMLPVIARPGGRDCVPAAHPLHQELIQIWEELLGVRPIGIRDHFFDLGGHSLLAMRMMDRIERLCGRRVHLAVLFQGGTIEQLATDLMRDDHQAPTFAQLILHRKGRGRPFIFVSGFLDLGRHLGPDHPFLGIDVPAEDKHRDPKTTFQDLADQCIAQVREFQPQGPYCLGGHCFGAVIAFEMAQKLVAQGQQVDLLALMEPAIPLSMSKRPGVDRYLFHVRKLFELSPAQQTLYLWNKIKVLANRAFSGINRSVLGLAEDSIDLDASFQPKPYSGKITVFFGKDTYYRMRPEKDPRLCWAQWALGGFEVFDIPGDHVTFCREPEVRVLSQRLCECIDRIAVAKPALPLADGQRAVSA